jgi:N-acetylglucosaminyl-diphospho-decaprenol L-rhamnosyltransferase
VLREGEAVSAGVVVVTYESERSLPALLESLAEHEPTVPVTVIDNASPSGPPPVPTGVKRVPLDRNSGFGAGCNRGVTEVLAEAPEIEAFAFLNPDVRLTGPTITCITEHLRARPGIGIATGPVVDGRGVRRPSAWGPPSATRAFWFASGLRLPRLRALVGRVVRGSVFTSAASMARDDVAVDGFVVGGAMVVRRECFEELGGFDESYFLFGEDVDICYRARQAGWQIRLLPAEPFIHDEGTSSEGVTADSRWQWYVEGSKRFAAKHLGSREARRIERALRWGRLVRGWRERIGGQR